MLNTHNQDNIDQEESDRHEPNQDEPDKHEPKQDNIDQPK